MKENITLEEALELLQQKQIEGFEFRQTLLGKEVPRYRVRLFGPDSYALHETMLTGSQGSGIYNPLGDFAAVKKMHARKTDSKEDEKIPNRFVEIEPLTPQFGQFEVHDASEELQEDFDRVSKLRSLYR